MRSVWEPQAAFAGWRAVELAVLDARVALGETPEFAAATARNAPIPTLAEIAAAEARTKHDVVAFLDVWTNTMPDEAACWVHRGLTSSDIVDTGLALQLTAASNLLIERATGLVIALCRHAIKHRNTGRIGRTHGMHATPDTWGHRVADFALAADRARARLLRARTEVAKAKISGPTGRTTSRTGDAVSWLTAPPPPRSLARPAHRRGPYRSTVAGRRPRSGSARIHEISAPPGTPSAPPSDAWHAPCSRRRQDCAGDIAAPPQRGHPGSMSDFAWTVTIIGGFVLVALLLRLAGAWLGAHDDDPVTRRVLPPR
jgi:hypothetical protein